VALLMDPSKAVAGAIASAHSCAACAGDFQDSYLRDFSGVPVCVDCYRDLGLLTLGELPADPEEALLARLLSVFPREVPAGAARRFATVERFASQIDRAGAESLLTLAARGGTATGMQELLWVLIAADALLRSGGRNGGRPLEGRELALLLNLAARVGMDISWAAMVDAGVATRSLDTRGAEWLYDDLVVAGGAGLAGLSAEKQAFAKYIRALKVKVDLLVKDIDERNDAVHIPLTILARTSDEVLAAFDQMDRTGKGGRGPPAA